MSGVLHSPTPPQSAALRSFASQWRTRPADSLSPLREQALQRFLSLGLPNQRDESWRYTNLRSLAAQSFVDAPLALSGNVEPGASLSLLGNSSAPTVTLVNGHPLWPVAGDLSNGIEIHSLRDIAQVDPMRLRRYLEPLPDADQQRWALLNTALYLDGLFIKITARLTVPLVILHIASGDDANAIAYPRVIVEAAPGSGAILIEQHVARGEQPPLINSSTQISLGNGAEVEHYRVYATGAGATHLDSLRIRQDRDSRCKQFTVALGGGLVRTNLEAHLDAPGASLESHSLLVGHEDRHVDCVNIVTHGAPDTQSSQTARAIAGDTSRLIFNSKVIVDAGAARSQSQQSCRGLLLSPDAEIDTRPQLEIHADEVKCAHGATTGRLDPDMLFYMLSRGLDRETAQSLLVFAFLADVLTGMSVESARAAIENALISQLPDSQTLRKFR
jgi:Fe-S cluster assembly protein SufD